MGVTHFLRKKYVLGFWFTFHLPPPPPGFNTSKRLIIELNFGHEFKVRLTYALCIFVVCAQYTPSGPFEDDF